MEEEDVKNPIGNITYVLSTLHESSQYTSIENGEEDNTPWIQFLGVFKSAGLLKGVSSICSCAVKRFDYFNRVQIPKSVISIENEEFCDCFSL